MLRSLTLRRALPVAVAVVLSVSLAGCGGGDDKDGKSSDKKVSSGCEFKSGSSSDAVKVDGEAGKTDPKVTFDKPLKADGLQRTIVTKGDGEPPAKDEQVDVVMTVINGRTGKTLGSAPAKYRIGDDTVDQEVRAAYDCVPVGSRTVATFEASDLMGEAGNPDSDIKGTDTLVVVTDVLEVAKPPKTVEWSNAPSVTFNGRKSPKVTLAKGAGSPDLLLKVIKAGTGATVESGSSVTVNYKGINQRTGKVFDESYGAGKSPATFTTDGVVAGFGAALVGQKVGTRLIVSIPPKYGYGASGNPQAGIKGTDVIVFVIEIQSTTPAS